MTIATQLIDSFGRVHDSLRISVTDRCNVRCFYCMPESGVQYEKRSEILDFEEIERFARIAAGLGITKLRVTGGEPLVRRDLPVLIRSLAAIPGIRDLALTTNGVLLPELAGRLYDAGLRRINVHLDTLDRGRFEQITRRDDLPKVLAGLTRAKELGFRIKLNAVAVKNLVEPDIVPLARFARENGFEVRYIEFMPLDAQGCGTAESADGRRNHRHALARDRAAGRRAGPRSARARDRIRLRRWRRHGGLHRLGEPSVLFELQSPAPHGRRQAALLPVRHRGDDVKSLMRVRRAGRRDRGAGAAERRGQMDRARDQFREVRAPPRPMYSIGGGDTGKSKERVNFQWTAER
jgi:molybdenum cofactor biosynthesis enzyme MoaA